MKNYEQKTFLNRFSNRRSQRIILLAVFLDLLVEIQEMELFMFECMNGVRKAEQGFANFK